MKIMLQQWREINALIGQAETALKAADAKIIDLALFHSRAGNDEEARLLLDLSSKINDGGPGGWGYMTHPQQEWTGGDSSDPANYTLREPNIVPMGKRFQREQVDAEQQKKVE